MEFLTILGTLASIVGAIISVQQAKKTVSNAEIAEQAAEQAKESILDKKTTEEIAKIHSKTKDLLEEIKK